MTGSHTTIVRLTGGIGNQLFQYAFGRTAVDAFGSDLYFDLSDYLPGAKRSYALYHFNVQAKIAGPRELHRVRFPLKKFHGVRAKLGHICRLPWKNVELRRERLDQRYRYCPEVREEYRHCYFWGVWQTGRYFHHLRKPLLEEITLRAGFSEGGQSLLNRIRSSRCPVALHVRRGDYTQKRKFSVCGKVYYERCLREIRSSFEEPTVFLFSDDINWVMENIDTDLPCVPVSDGGAGSDCEELLIMSECSHHIVSNSSFSWWGAWLNRNPDQLVLSPDVWLNREGGTPDVWPQGWQKIPVGEKVNPAVQRL